MSTNTNNRRNMRAHAHVPWLILTIVLVAVFVVPAQAELNPDFAGTPRSGFSPLTIQFNDTSTGFVEPVSYIWDFGDGNTSVKQNPLYIYYKPGTYTVKLDISNASGDQATLTQKEFITVEAPVIAEPLVPDFSGTPVSGTAPLTIQFTDASTGPVDLWEWDFGDENTSSKQNPKYTYTQPGSYTIKLVISNSSGEQATLIKKEYITVDFPIIPDPLIPDFTGTPRTGIAPLNVQFSDKSSGSLDRWEWDFGDGNTSSKQNPQYIYNEPGTYPVKLTISNSSGEQATLSQNDYITVNPAPATIELIPNFTGTPHFGVSPLTVQFTDTSSGFTEPVTYLWDFGDGNTSSKQNPQYTFEQPGTFSVTLTLGQDSGTLATILHKDYISVNSVPAANELIPEFIAKPRSGVSPLTVQFNDTSTGFVEPVTYLWDFGDGNTSSKQNPLYTYNEPGSFSVQLDISNASGEQATILHKDYITVTAPPITGELIPEFNATPRSGVSPLTVQFNDRSKGFVEPITYLWDFGDGNTSSKQNPINIYNGPGSYSVKLDINNASGEKATILHKDYITVASAPLVLPVTDFFGTPTSGNAPLTVAFTDLTTNTPTSWNWSFSDDSTENATQQNPVHSFAAAGNYTISLIATNPNGSDSQTRAEYIKVNPGVVHLTPPVADFSGKPTSGVVPLTVSFTDLSTNTPTSWNWVFGDDSSENATQQNPVHTYTNSGNYTVSLKVTNGDGSDTQTRTEYINVNAVPVSQPVATPPFADFSGKPTSGDSPLTVSFKDLSTNAPTSWNWSFGDDSIENATQQNPVHIYTNSGNYTVSLKVTNGDGSDTQTRTEYIEVNAVPVSQPVATPPFADFMGKPTSGDSPLTISFKDLSINAPTSWTWSFGDDSLENATQQNPVHTYINPGNYTVSLNATNADGSDIQIRTEYIKVNAVPVSQPVAEFSGEPFSGVAPLTVTFTDLSTNTPTSWNWSFGDDSLENSTEQNPLHTYTNPGNYTILLNATNADGSDTSIRTDYISVFDVSLAPLIPEPLLPNLTAIPTSGPAPLTVQFNDTSTGLHNQWEWKFGDGNSSSEQNPLYTYNEPGSYSVILNVSQTGEDSISTIREDYITVVTPLIPIPLNATPLVSNFTGTPMSGPAPLIVQFNDTSTGLHDQWEWKFGDGNSSSEQNPLYTYNEPGSYSVILNVSQAGGDSVSTTHQDYIRVSAVSLVPPVADFSGTPTSGVAPLTVTFTDLSTNSPLSWNWSFGDDSFENATEQTPVHTYANPGNYTVSLDSTNTAGSNITTKTSYINITAVSSGPVADFSGTPTSGIAPLTVQFNDISTGFHEPITYFWDFGDGFNSSTRNPTHTYSAATLENYTVTLNVSGNYGQTDEMKKPGYVSIEIPTIELILTEESLDQIFTSNEPIPPSQSLPLGQSLPMAKSVLQSKSLPQGELGYQDQSLPRDISTHNELSAVLQSPNIQWPLNRGENTNPHAFSMIVHSTVNWTVVVYDAANYGKPGTPGKMSEYDYPNNRYLTEGYSLLNALHLQTEQFKYPTNLGPEVILSNSHDPLQTGFPMVRPDDPFKYYINLKQRVEDSDHASNQNIGYRIVITFEAIPR